MATTKTIQTRIKNRFDTLTNWQGQGVSLLPGEIALVSVTTKQIDQATGDVVNVPAVLMKVGASDGNGGTKAFNELPWVSALAADVYDWAKGATAEAVPVTIKVNNTDTAGTLGGWLQSISDQAATNAGDISALSARVDVESVSAAISEAVKALVHTGTQGANQIVKAVTQADGKVTVTYGTITEAELPNISSGKIIVDDKNTTLTSKLSTMDAAIAAADSKAGHSHPYLPDTTMWAKGATQGGAAESANKVNQSITVTLNGGTTEGTDKFTFDGSTAKSVDITPEDIGAATYASIYGSDGKGGINAQVETNKADIANLKSAVTGGVHFIGTVTTAPTSSTIKVGEHTVAVGDVVIYKGTADTDYKEYICTAATATTATWEPLGDVTRIGALETKLDNLDYSEVIDGAAVNSKFVTKVTQTDGKIAVTYAQPASADIKHGTNSTVNDKLGDIDAVIATKANSSDVYTIAQTDSAIATAKTEAATDAANKAVVALAEAQAYADNLNSAIDARVDALETAKENADAAFEDIKSNYVRYTKVTGTDKYQMHLGDSTEVIIFDCGGAPVE